MKSNTLLTRRSIVIVLNASFYGNCIREKHLYEKCRGKITHVQDYPQHVVGNMNILKLPIANSRGK